MEQTPTCPNDPDDGFSEFSDEALLRANIERSNFVALFVDRGFKRPQALGNIYRKLNASILPISERNSLHQYARYKSKSSKLLKRTSASALQPTRCSMHWATVRTQNSKLSAPAQLSAQALLSEQAQRSAKPANITMRNPAHKRNLSHKRKTAPLAT